MRFMLLFLFFFSISISFAGALHASEQQAAQLAHNAQYDSAIAVYTQLLQDDPENASLLIGRGYAYSWQGQYQAALADFGRVLSMESENSDAMTGAAYTHAWAGNYATADSLFKRVQELEPSRNEIPVARAYVALWRGNLDEALTRFEYMKHEMPENGEVLMGLAQTQIEAGQLRSARRSLESLLQLQPENETAQKLLNDIRNHTAFMELSINTGYSNLTTNETFGVRSFGLLFRPLPNLMVNAHYDNTLSLDNSQIISMDKSAPLYKIGAGISWHKDAYSKLEAGRRDVSGISQTLLMAEQVLFLDDIALKAGAVFGANADFNDEWMVFGGASFPIMKSLSLEPHYFFSDNGIDNQQRFLLASTYRFSRDYELSGGLLYGRFSGTRNDDIFGAHLSFNAPLVENHWWSLRFNHEELPGYSQNVIALGLRLRLER